MSENNVFYIHNPSKVPSKYEKFLHDVIVEKNQGARIKDVGKAPTKVLYHSHYPTFVRISKELQKAGINMSRPLYGFMLAGKFHAISGLTTW